MLPFAVNISPCRSLLTCYSTPPRALTTHQDWDVDGPFKDYSAVTVSHASEDGSGDPNSWANVG